MHSLGLALATALACPLVPTPSRAPVGAVAADTLVFGRFGAVTLYGNRADPNQVVLFVSGDGGWNLGVVAMARQLASLNTLVVGIDIRRYLRAVRADSATCAYPAADFEALSQYVQRSLGLAHYHPPILVGYSSGATLVYAVLAEGPAGTFRGALSLGFCPDLPLARALCPGSGLAQVLQPNARRVLFRPVQRVPAPWVVLQGEIDQVCDPDAARAFVRQVEGAELVSLPKVGHGFGVPDHWLPAFRAGFMRIAGSATGDSAVTDPALGDLPLVRVPAARTDSAREVAVMISGDGGWAGLDRGVARVLADQGIPVIGLNSLQYFWHAKTQESFAADLTRTIDHALATAGVERVILVGYSFGADVLPFAVNRLPETVRRRLAAVVLIGLSDRAAFEFHLGSWLGETPGRSFPTRPELERLRTQVPAARLLCVAGADETDSACPADGVDGFRTVVLPGGHHLGGDYRTLAEVVLGRSR